jgi:uncharacterized damage-inducible protein DinB
LNIARQLLNFRSLFISLFCLSFVLKQTKRTMDTSFFEDSFRFDFHANELWGNYLLDQEGDFPDLNRIMSHLFNAHHLWIRRIRGEQVESGVWDIFEPRHFVRLNHQNFSETLDYLEHAKGDAMIRYTASDQQEYEIPASQLLYHILHHSAHHRGQLALLAAAQGLHEKPVHNYVGFVAKKTTE